MILYAGGKDMIWWDGFTFPLEGDSDFVEDLRLYDASFIWKKKNSTQEERPTCNVLFRCAFRFVWG